MDALWQWASQEESRMSSQSTKAYIEDSRLSGGKAISATFLDAKRVKIRSLLTWTVTCTS